jgi:hypothetical protein
MLVIATRTATLSDTVNAEGRYYGNALQAASYNGHKEVVHMLLDRDADANALESITIRFKLHHIGAMKKWCRCC